MMSEQPQQPDGLVGVVLDGRYRLIRALSQGGMGTVYEALHVRLNKPVAVKVMVPELATNKEALARFRREIEVTSQLAHPHLIQLLDFGTTAAGQPYLVMEFLSGEDLDQRLRRVGRLPLTTAIDVVKQAASGLAEPHAKGIVHRDLKPANLFLVPTEGAPDFVKVLDFGISKIRTARTKLTRVATIVGTPNYVSPEQATGRVDDVDHRSDQWALGCIAWQMLSGSVPFAAGDDINAVLSKIVRDEPASLAAQVPQIPAEVETVLRRALAKKQGDRFPTILAFARALERAAPPLPSTPAPVMVTSAPFATHAPHAGRRGSVGMISVVALVALVAGAALYHFAAPHLVGLLRAAPAMTPETKPAAKRGPGAIGRRPQ